VEAAMPSPMASPAKSYDMEDQLVDLEAAF
jgi:hypothetical protein